MEGRARRTSSNMQSSRPDHVMQLIKNYEESERRMSPEEKALRDEVLADMKTDGWYGCGMEADENDGEILMDWFGKGCIITYGVDAHNPDWSFLDDWDLQDVEVFYEAHAHLPIAYSLAEYLEARRNP